MIHEKESLYEVHSMEKEVFIRAAELHNIPVVTVDSKEGMEKWLFVLDWLLGWCVMVGFPGGTEINSCFIQEQIREKSESSDMGTLEVHGDSMAFQRPSLTSVVC